LNPSQFCDVGVIYRRSTIARHSRGPDISRIAPPERSAKGFDDGGSVAVTYFGQRAEVVAEQVGDGVALTSIGELAIKICDHCCLSQLCTPPHPGCQPEPAHARAAAQAFAGTCWSLLRQMLAN